MNLGLEIEIEEVENKTLLRLDGRIDAHSAPLLEKKIDSLIDQGKTSLLCDFTKIDYLSSAGLRVLLSSTKKTKAKKGIFVLFSLQEDVFDVVKMVGFERLLTLCPSEKEALSINP